MSKTFRLLKEHPDAFADAAAYEKTAAANGSPFTWSQGESLEELSREDRMAQIQSDFQRRQERARAARKRNPLSAQTGQESDVDSLYGIDEASAGCVICHK
ncbi:hypothetical protein GCM10017620_31100 [Brevundimonas intermedia]|uniref:Uncharacterized protein n=1 Tax=Brevundimonas intermedia TaxID=74315 RepID=A0ABQ5TC21_9CAUL|nr:hypothetical protein GCM10017620_31100 [Brevundimonas intermedia]